MNYIIVILINIIIKILMLVGKRKYFEDETNEVLLYVIQSMNPTFALRRRITQDKNLESLSQARKRLTL
jgi:hypothetical protein